jgi:hypothetical protein
MWAAGAQARVPMLLEACPVGLLLKSDLAWCAPLQSYYRFTRKKYVADRAAQIGRVSPRMRRLTMLVASLIVSSSR